MGASWGSTATPTPPPPLSNFKDCIKCKGKRYKKKEKIYMKVRDKGGGVPTNIFRGLRVL